MTAEGYPYGRMEVQFPQLEMVRPHLEQIPELRLPDGYRMRTYQPGDERPWAMILSRAFGAAWSEQTFRMMIKGHFGFRPGRVFFLCHGAKPVGSACAFEWPGLPKGQGYIHMVGLSREHCGRGLGQALVTACLNRFKQEGCFSSVMLQTETYRLPAIKHYLRLGFTPVLVREEQRFQWREILRHVGMPEKIEEFNLDQMPVMGKSEFYARNVKIFIYTAWLQVKFPFASIAPGRSSSTVPGS